MPNNTLEDLILSPRIRTVLLAVCLAASLHAQTPSKTFELASIRLVPAGADPNEGFWSLPGSPKFTAHHLSLKLLIQLAYGAVPTEVINVPSWAETQLYDIQADPGAGVSLTPEELEPRLQALLAERFHLTVHREDRVLSGYALVVGKQGVTMKPGNPAGKLNVRHASYAGHIELINCTMAFLARQITAQEGIPCADHTGLTGFYDVKLTYTPALAPVTTQNSIQPPLTTAIQEQAGLRLEAAKINVHTTVIDGVDRTPTEN